jgi:H+-transporting ATPase
VRKTGINTEVGSSQAEIMQDKTKEKISVFEMRVLTSVKIIIAVTIVDVIIILIVQGVARKQFNVDEIATLVLTCLSILIASIPVALPLVLQVTMALGAGKMARDFHAVVTSLPALQDISSMSVLCSDKTGTLTTAKITIHQESVWYNGKFTKEDVALYAMLAANRDKKEDAIDRSVVNHFDAIFGPAGEKRCAEYKKIRSVGFNPIYKRVLYELEHPKDGRMIISKGLPAKVRDTDASQDVCLLSRDASPSPIYNPRPRLLQVMNTKDGGEDDAADQWEVENYKEMHPEVAKVRD